MVLSISSPLSVLLTWSDVPRWPNSSPWELEFVSHASSNSADKQNPLMHTSLEDVSLCILYQVIRGRKIPNDKRFPTNSDV